MSVPSARPSQKVQFALDDSLGYLYPLIHFFLSSTWGQCAQRSASPLNDSIWYHGAESSQIFTKRGRELKWALGGSLCKWVRESAGDTGAFRMG